MKVYLSGKITGTKDYKRKFARYKKELEDKGYEAVNPVEFGSEDLSWAENMKIVLPLMLSCDCIMMLPDWKLSKGAKIEYDLALALGMYIFYKYF